MVQLLKDGAVTQEYAYDAYGYINADEFGIQAPFYGYNGEEQNPFTGLQYLRARYYAPQNGGFITQDSFSGVLTNALSQNRYTYAHNNPVNYADPSGHSIWDSIKNGVTNAVNSVKNFVSNVANKVSSAVSSAVNTVKSAVTGTTTKTVANTSSAVKKSYTNTAVRQKIGSYAGGAAAATAGSVSTSYSNSVVDGVVADSRIPFTNAAGQTISVPSHFSNLAEAAKDFVRRVCDAEMQRIETQRAVEQAQQKILSDTVHSAGNAISAFYKAWNANANYWHDYYNNATNVGDFLYGGVNYFTYGLIDGINKSYQQRHQEMLDDFTLYNIANWGLSGIPDRVKGAIAPEDPLSLQHWLDSFSVVMIGYGLYQGYQFANAPANTINTAHPVTGTGMLDDFADDAANNGSPQIKVNYETGTAWDIYVQGTQLKGVDAAAQLETQRTFVTNAGTVRPDYTFYNNAGDVLAIEDAKAVSMIQYDAQAKGFLELAASTQQKTIIYYVPEATPIAQTYVDQARLSGINLIQVVVP